MSILKNLSPDQRQEIQREYDQIQLQDRAEDERRRAWVRQECPQYADIQRQIAEISVQALRDKMNGNRNEGPDYSERISELAERQAMYLENLGVPKDFLEPVCECRKCHDTGFIKVSVPPDSAAYYEKSENGRSLSDEATNDMAEGIPERDVPGPDREAEHTKRPNAPVPAFQIVPCSCYIKKAIHLLYGSIGSQYLKPYETFDSFALSLYDAAPLSDDARHRSPFELAKEALQIAEHYVDTFDAKKSGSLLLCGPTGVGKTFLTNCIVNELMDKNVNILYMRASDLFDELSFADKSEAGQARRKEVRALSRSCELLVIDDLGSEASADFKASILLETLDARQTHHLPTLISTNLSGRNLQDRYSERVSSRLTDFTWVRLAGDDIRSQRFLQNQQAR